MKNAAKKPSKYSRDVICEVAEILDTSREYVRQVLRGKSNKYKEKWGTASKIRGLADKVLERKAELRREFQEEHNKTLVP